MVKEWFLTLLSKSLKLQQFLNFKSVISRQKIHQKAKQSDPQSVMSEELREKLFQLANKSGFDLASLNMQRSFVVNFFFDRCARGSNSLNDIQNFIIVVIMGFRYTENGK